MKKTEVSQYFKDNFPSIYYSHDLPMKREAWSNYVDSLQRDGLVSEKQASTWTQPAWVNKVVKRKIFEVQQYLFGIWETVSYEHNIKDARRTLKDYEDNQPQYPARIRHTFE